MKQIKFVYSIQLFGLTRWSPSFIELTFVSWTSRILTFDTPPMSGNALVHINDLSFVMKVVSHLIPESNGS